MKILFLFLFLLLCNNVYATEYVYKFEHYNFVLKETKCKLNIPQTKGMLEYSDNFPVKSIGCWKIDDFGRIYTLIYYPKKGKQKAEIRGQYSESRMYKPVEDIIKPWVK